MTKNFLLVDLGRGAFVKRPLPEFTEPKKENQDITHKNEVVPAPFDFANVKGVGIKMLEWLNKNGIETLEQLKEADLSDLTPAQQKIIKGLVN